MSAVTTGSSVPSLSNTRVICDAVHATLDGTLEAYKLQCASAARPPKLRPRALREVRRDEPSRRSEQQVIDKRCPPAASGKSVQARDHRAVARGPDAKATSRSARSLDVEARLDPPERGSEC